MYNSHTVVAVNFSRTALASSFYSRVRACHLFVTDAQVTTPNIIHILGITLGLLYESVPESSGLNELVLQVLIIMHDHKGWERALEVYGPAPPREYSTQPHRINTTGRRHQKSKSTTLPGRFDHKSPEDTPRSVSVAEGPPEFRTSLNQRKTTGMKAVVIDPTHCLECETPFTNTSMIQECDCGTVTIRYPERYELMPESSIIARSAPKPRPRSKTI